MNYNYFRDYDPATGRYVQSDPIGLDGGISTFGYAANDPVQSLDPMGLVAAISAYRPGKNTVCCDNGQMKLCMHDSMNKRYKCATVVASFNVHEQSHYRQYVYALPRLCAGTRGRFSLGWTTDGEHAQSEMMAFAAQRRFLESALGNECLSPDCKREIPFMINWIDGVVRDGNFPR